MYYALNRRNYAILSLVNVNGSFTPSLGDLGKFGAGFSRGVTRVSTNHSVPIGGTFCHSLALLRSLHHGLHGWWSHPAASDTGCHAGRSTTGQCHHVLLHVTSRVIKSVSHQRRPALRRHRTCVQLPRVFEKYDVHVLGFKDVDVFVFDGVQASATRVISVRVEVNVKFRVRVHLILVLAQFQLGDLLRSAFQLQLLRVKVSLLFRRRAHVTDHDRTATGRRAIAVTGAGLVVNIGRVGDLLGNVQRFEGAHGPFHAGRTFDGHFRIFHKRRAVAPQIFDSGRVTRR